MARFINFSLRHRAVVVLATVLLLVTGAVSVAQLSQELFPSINAPFLVVSAAQPGAGPSSIAQDVATPIEDAIEATPGVESVSSTSAEGFVVVTAEYAYGTDMEEREREVRDRIAAAGLPEGVQASAQRVNPASLPVYSVAVVGDDQQAAEALVDDVLRPALIAVDGVAQVVVSGSREQVVVVTLDPDALSDEGMTVGDVVNAIGAADLSTPAGSVEPGDRQQTVRVTQPTDSLEGVARLMVASGRPPIPIPPPAVPPPAGPPGAGAARSTAAPSSPVAEPGAAQGTPPGTIIDLGTVQPAKDSTGLVIDLDRESLTRRGLVAGDVARALSAAGLAGLVTIEDQLRIFVPGEALSAKEVGALRVTAPERDVGAPAVTERVITGAREAGAMPVAQGAPVIPRTPEAVPLEELGTVELGDEDVASLSRTNGRPSITLEVTREQDANTVDVVDGITAALDDIALPGGLELVEIVNQAPSITDAVEDLVRDALLGAVFVIVMILLFLRSLRGTLVTGISIPLSLLIAFILMRAQGITLNVLTLGALSVAAGRVVDDSIVVLENIYRQLEQGYTRTEAVVAGTSQVFPAITGATVTTCAVFVPLAFVGGLIGEAFAGFSLTIVFALAASLVVAITVIPVCADLFLRVSGARQKTAGREGIGRFARRPLAFALRHRALTLVTAFALLAGSLATLTQVPVVLFPRGETSTLEAEVQAPTGTNLGATTGLVAGLEARLATVEGVEH
ncbi:MAG: efflux RND transporter permease subunit, partial [Egibacteraceae bacterium]